MVIRFPDLFKHSTQAVLVRFLVSLTALSDYSSPFGETQPTDDILILQTLNTDMPAEPSAVYSSTVLTLSSCCYGIAVGQITQT